MLPVRTGKIVPPEQTKSFSGDSPTYVFFIERNGVGEIQRVIATPYTPGDEPPAVKAMIHRNESQLQLDKLNSVEWARS